MYPSFEMYVDENFLITTCFFLVDDFCVWFYFFWEITFLWNPIWTLRPRLLASYSVFPTTTVMSCFSFQISRRGAWENLQHWCRSLVYGKIQYGDRATAKTTKIVKTGKNQLKNRKINWKIMLFCTISVGIPFELRKYKQKQKPLMFAPCKQIPPSQTTVNATLRVDRLLPSCLRYMKWDSSRWLVGAVKDS